MAKKGETGTPGGRPPFEITEKVLKQAEAFSANGLNLKEIAGVLGISYETLNEKKKEFPEFSLAIEEGRAKGVGTIKNKFFDKAKKGDNQCMIMYLKNYSDMKDRQDVEHSGSLNVTMPESDAGTL
jgi:hypothetical protein